MASDGHQALTQHADTDRQSRVSLLDVEDMRRRCSAHEQWMSSNPDARSFAETWADQNLEELPHRR